MDLVQLLSGDARTVLAGLEPQSVHACITSPPYFGLRSYGGGEHEIGTEQTPAAYVDALVEVFRAVWHVLRDDGTLWVVLGDSYASGGSGGASPKSTLKNDGRRLIGARNHEEQLNKVAYSRRAPAGMPGKNLLGIPWRVAFALQDDGWILRQEVIWHKPNPMPESVKDRCTRGHETVFMLAKGRSYFYDQAAIAEPISAASTARIAQPTFAMQRGGVKDYASGTNPNRSARRALESFATHQNGTRNARSVWTVATAPLSSKKYGVQTEHYAAFPPELVRPMVRAACPLGATVLDPFCGSGTTGLVAVHEGRGFTGIDLNGDYLRLAEARIAAAQPRLPLAM